MRNVLFCLVCMISVACASADEAVLKFNVTEPTAKEVVLVCGNDILTYNLDENGCVEAVIDGYDAVYAKLFYGPTSRTLYFEKGDKAYVSFDGSDFDSSFSYEGDNYDAVKYLNTVMLTALPDVDYALPFDQYFDKIKKKEADAVKLLEANSIRNSGNFVEIERGRIRYAYAATLLMHPVGHMIMTGNMDYKPDQAYYDVIRTYFVENQMYACLSEYRSFIAEAAHVLDQDGRQLTSVYPKTIAQMKFVADSFSSRKPLESVMHYIATTYVDNYGVDNIQELENLYYTYVKTPSLHDSFKAKYDRWDVSAPGKKSPGFTAVDIDGRSWTLADFRGRYVYIDMWATWCAPCRRELPYLKSLADKFKDAQISFVGLSIDSDKEKWADMVNNDEMPGVQLYLGTGSSFQKNYGIDAIPRFILIDKSGRIISNDMSRPSSDETYSFLESLDGIR